MRMAPRTGWRTGKQKGKNTRDSEAGEERQHSGRGASGVTQTAAVLY